MHEIKKQSLSFFDSVLFLILLIFSVTVAHINSMPNTCFAKNHTNPIIIENVGINCFYATTTVM